MYYNSSYYSNLNAIRVYEDARRIGDSIASEINLALKAGDGYSRVFYIPEKILNSYDYNISVKNYRIYLFWAAGSYQATILTSGIVGELKKGENYLRNVGGIIYVN